MALNDLRRDRSTLGFVLGLIGGGLVIGALIAVALWALWLAPRVGGAW